MDNRELGTAQAESSARCDNCDATTEDHIWTVTKAGKRLCLCFECIETFSWYKVCQQKTPLRALGVDLAALATDQPSNKRRDNATHTRGD